MGGRGGRWGVGGERGVDVCDLVEGMEWGVESGERRSRLVGDEAGEDLFFSSRRRHTR